MARMPELSELVNRKFIDSKTLDNFEVWTDSGWQDISHIHKTVEYTIWRLETDGGKVLEGADTHIVFDDSGNQIFIKDLLPNVTRILTEDGPELVISCVECESSEHMFDITVSSDDHSFYSNRILSHNSSAVCAFALHYIIFNAEKNIAILANKAATAVEILGRIKKAYELLPDFLKHGIEEWNKGRITLENGSRIFAASTSSDSIRGFSINCLVLDETAFVQNWDEFYTSTFPTISSGTETKVIMVSTPNGLNHFYKFWNDANKDKDDPEWNQFNPVAVTWDQVPGRDEAWRIQTLAGMNNDSIKFAQEYEIEFQGSSGTLISGAALKALASKNPLHSTLEVKQYKAPKPKHSYVIVADVSRGKGLDYSAAQIIDTTQMPYEQVATYRSNMVTPTDYAKELFILSKLYNQATILVEVNDIGGQVSDILYDDYGCETLLFTESAGARGKRISTGYSKTADRGIRTTKTVKAVGCSILKLLIEQQQLLIHDFDTIQELSRFSKKGTSYEAEKGSTDDLVMGLVLFAWLSNQDYFKELTDINTIMALRDKSDEDLENNMSILGFSNINYPDEEEDNTIIDLSGSYDSLPSNYRDLLKNF